MSPNGIARAQPFLEAQRIDSRCELQIGRKVSLGRPFCDEFDRCKQADATHLADKRMWLESNTKRVQQIGTNVGGIGAQSIVLDHRDVGKRGRCTHRVRGIGIAMAEQAVLGGASLQCLPHALADKYGRQRGIGAGQALGDGDQIGLNAVGRVSEHRAATTKAGDDLVENQEDVVPTQHFLNSLPLAGRRRHDAASADDGLGNEGANGLGAFR